VREPVAWRDYGAGAPLLLIHGDFSNGADAWGTVVDALAGRRRSLVVDRRGHGASPRAPRPYAIAADAADLVDVLDAAGVEAAHVVGHSYGGLVAVELAAAAPDRVQSLHLLEPPWLALAASDLEASALDGAVRRIRDRASLAGPEETAAAFFRLFTTPAGLDALRASSRWPGIVREAGRMADGEYGGDYPAARLERLGAAVPLAVYRGGRSHPGLRNVAAEIVRRRPSARLTTLSDAGHAMQHSPAFVEALLASTEQGG
jgi:pimeloyl-ACP methyl ester carboxylesterase